MNKYSKQQGLSLIELMISITLGAFIVIGAAQAYFGSRQASRFTEGITDIQENARFIFDEINASIRQAGDMGCRAKAVRYANLGFVDLDGDSADDTDVPRLKYNSVVIEDGVNADVWFTHFYRGIEAYTGTVADAGFLNGKQAKTASDVLVIHRLDPSTLNALDDPTLPAVGHDAATQTMTTESTQDFTEGNVLLIVDPKCQEASLFLKSDANTTTTIKHEATVLGGYDNCSTLIGSSDPQLGAISCPASAPTAATQTYANNSILAKVGTAAYFVKTDNSLMRLSAGQASADALVDGVEAMVLKFGVDTDADGVANQYKTTATIVTADWINVVTIRVGLIMVSNTTGFLDVADKITCNGVDSATDTKLRKCIVSTINIRNRGGQNL